jgi:hypothetical protein
MQALLDFTFDKAIQLVYGMSVVLLWCLFVPDIMYRGVSPVVKLDICHKCQMNEQNTQWFFFINLSFTYYNEIIHVSTGVIINIQLMIYISLYSHTIGRSHKILLAFVFYAVYEPRHDKTNKVGLRPAWIQTSLRIRAV